MKINKIKSSKNKFFDDAFIIEPKIYSDERGYFFESWNQNEFSKYVDTDLNPKFFVQDNHSFSKKGVLRGLHFQLKPKEQGKLVRCISGLIMDVIVDIRPNSSTFSQWAKIQLSCQNKLQVWIPPGFAHGFLTLSNQAEVLYKTTDFYYPEYERTIQWNDKSLDISWDFKINAKLISKKDNAGKSFKELFN